MGNTVAVFRTRAQPTAAAAATPSADLNAERAQSDATVQHPQSQPGQRPAVDGSQPPPAAPSNAAAPAPINDSEALSNELEKMLADALEAGSPAPLQATKKLTIIHFNDVYRVDSKAKEPVAGAARFRTAIKQLEPENPLILFSGDVFNPSLLSTITRGKHMVPVLENLGVHCACFGNHDFDFGLETLEELITDLPFPWLLANVLDPITMEPLSGGIPSTVIEHNGVKVGLVGLVEFEWIVTIEALGDPDSYVYEDFAQAGNREGELLRSQGADIVIALTHMRMPNAERLARECAAVDMILNGHDHFYEKKIINDKIVQVSGTDFENLTCFRLEIGSKKIVSASSEEVTITSKFEEDRVMKRIVKNFMDDMEAAMQVVIGHTSTDLDARTATVRTKESNIGNLTADVMRAYTKADIALLNGGTIRADTVIGAGPLKAKHLMDLFPIEDAVVVLSLTGEAIKAALENGVSMWPRHEGRFLQVSGLGYQFDPSLPKGERVQKIWLWKGGQHCSEEPFDLTRQYNVAIRAYLSKGFDGFDCLKGARYVVDEESGVFLATMMRTYFGYLKTVSEFIRQEKTARHHDAPSESLSSLFSLQKSPSAIIKGAQNILSGNITRKSDAKGGLVGASHRNLPRSGSVNMIKSVSHVDLPEEIQGSISPTLESRIRIVGA